MSGMPPSTEVLLHLQDVHLRQGTVSSLSAVNLQLWRGERLALVGANGSGKSSLLRLMHGLVRPSQGHIWSQPGLRQAMLFQRPWMMRTTVWRNLRLGLWLAGVRGAEGGARTQAALARVGLQALADRPARTLSGGQQQRLALARAWALQPDVLLLDEPTASLDPHAKQEVEQLMADFAAVPPSQTHAPVAMVFASHNLGQVKRLASRVIYLERGQVLADLPTPQFFDDAWLRHKHPAAHGFLRGELV